MGGETTQVSQSIAGRGNRECKSPETESCLGCSRSREEASGSGAEGAWEEREERRPKRFREPSHEGQHRLQV